MQVKVRKITQNLRYYKPQIWVSSMQLGIKKCKGFIYLHYSIRGKKLLEYIGWIFLLVGLSFNLESDALKRSFGLFKT